MSLAKTRKALEQKLNAMTPALQTVWENHPADLTVGTPFQVASLIPGPTQNNTMGNVEATLATEIGIFQVMLHYPVDSGSTDALTRAEAIVDWFKRGLSLSQDGAIIVIDRTPSVGPAQPSDSWYRVPVSISYYSHVLRT